MANGNRGPSGRCGGRKQNCITCGQYGPTSSSDTGQCWGCQKKEAEDMEREHADHEIDPDMGSH